MAFWIPIALVLGFAVYSWYWQATIQIYAKYRVSSLIWSLILVVIAFNSGILTQTDPNLVIFLAAFILMSIIDGVGGLSQTHVVASGYFKRAIKYGELSKITLIPVPTAKKPAVMAIFTTLKNQTYYLRFNKQVEDLIVILHSETDDSVEIEIQSLM